MTDMFHGCSSLTKLDLINFNTQNVTNMQYMFCDCCSLTELDVSKFNIYNVTDMGDMFAGCNENAGDKIKSAFVRGNLHNFRNELNQIVWCARCNEMEFLILNNDADAAGDKWILAEKYTNSRRKVIGKAIADCVTGENEFAGKPAGDIITFDEKAYPNKYISPQNYDKKHWNAVIFYNYIHEAMNGADHYTERDQYEEYICDVNNLLNKSGKLEAIRKYYKTHYTKNLNALYKNLEDAVKDIQRYVNALGLQSDLYSFRIHKQNYNKIPDIMDIAPGVKKAPGNDLLIFSKFCTFCKTISKGDNIHRMAYIPSLRVYNNNLYIFGFHVSEQYWDKNKWTNKTGDFKWFGYNSLCTGQGKWLQDLLTELKLAEVPDKDILKQWACPPLDHGDNT